MRSNSFVYNFVIGGLKPQISVAGVCRNCHRNCHRKHVEDGWTYTTLSTRHIIDFFQRTHQFFCVKGTLFSNFLRRWPEFRRDCHRRRWTHRPICFFWTKRTYPFRILFTGDRDCYFKLAGNLNFYWNLAVYYAGNGEPIHPPQFFSSNTKPFGFFSKKNKDPIRNFFAGSGIVTLNSPEMVNPPTYPNFFSTEMNPSVFS